MQQQMLNKSEHKIRYPSLIGQIILVSIMSILRIRMLFILFQNDNLPWMLIYIECIVLVIFIIWLSCMIIKAFKKPSILRLDQRSLFVNGHTVEGHQIKIVMVMATSTPL